MRAALRRPDPLNASVFVSWLFFFSSLKAASGCHLDECVDMHPKKKKKETKEKTAAIPLMVIFVTWS